MAQKNHKIDEPLNSKEVYSLLNQKQLKKAMEFPLNSHKLIELTHPLSEHAPTWNGSCGFCLETKQDYDKTFRCQQIKMHGGIGTHMDAPAHRFQGAATISDIPLEQFVAPACVIDVSRQAACDYLISVEDIRAFEHIHGTIPCRALVIGYTGWDRFWDNRIAYRNADSQGIAHYPGFSSNAAELLLERGICGIAIDTLSPDCLDSDFPVHKLVLGAGKYIIENIANASLLPPIGSSVITLPLYIEGAAEAPVRMVGFFS